MQYRNEIEKDPVCGKRSNRSGNLVYSAKKSLAKQTSKHMHYSLYAKQKKNCDCLKGK